MAETQTTPATPDAPTEEMETHVPTTTRIRGWASKNKDRIKNGAFFGAGFATGLAVAVKTGLTSDEEDDEVTEVDEYLETTDTE